MNKIEIAFIKFLVRKELTTLEKQMFESSSNPIEYMEYKELYKEYSKILSKLD